MTEIGTIEIDFNRDGLKLNATLSRDGDKFCILFGQNIQEGICGFGSSIWEAKLSFTDNFRNELATIIL